MNLTKFSPPGSHFGITIFQQEEEKRGIPLYQTWHIVNNSIILQHKLCHIKWYHILSYQVASPHIPSYPIVLWPLLSYSIISHHIKPQHIKPPSSFRKYNHNLYDWKPPRRQWLLLISKAHKLRIKVIN